MMTIKIFYRNGEKATTFVSDIVRAHNFCTETMAHTVVEKVELLTNRGKLIKSYKRA